MSGITVIDLDEDRLRLGSRFLAASRGRMGLAHDPRRPG